MSRNRNFCMTVNNPTGPEGKILKRMKEIRYGVIGVEIGKSGTLHIQGYVQLEKPKTLKCFQKILKKKGIKCHIEVAKGSLEQNQKYCKKDGKFTEWGTAKTKGQRTDLNSMYKLITDGATNAQIREQMPNTYMKYYKAVDRVKSEIQNETAKEYMRNVIAKDTPRKWQTKAVKTLEKQNDRQVLWIVDHEGNKGKTWLAKWLILNKGAYYIQGGKSVDIAHGYNNEEYVVFDYTRSQEELINYSVIESFKNGLMFSPKYDSKMKVFKPAKVLCLSNFEPDMSKLSVDRWNIKRLQT